MAKRVIAAPAIKMPPSGNYSVLPPWFCETGCGWECELVRIETSTELLRLTFRCPVCHSTVKRHFDLQNQGFIEGPGVNPDHSVNACNYVGSHQFNGRDCPHRDKCGRVKRFLDSATSTENPVEMSAGKLASTISGLGVEDLKFCFSCFHPGCPPDGARFELFQAAYSAHSAKNQKR